MKTFDIVKRAGHNLARAKVRTLLTAVAISVGGFAIVLSLAAGNGARHYVDQVISANMDPQELVVYGDERFTDLSSASGFAPGLREYDPNSMSAQGIDFTALTEKDIKKLKENDSFRDVRTTFQITPEYVTFSLKKDKKYVSPVADYNSTTTSQVVAGSVPDKHQQIADDEAIIPQPYLKTLDVDDAQKAVGSTITVRAVQPPQDISKEKLQEAFVTGGEDAVKKLTEGKTIEKNYKIVAVTGSSVNQLDQQQGIFISNSAAKELNDFAVKGTKQAGKYMMAMATVKDGLKPEDVKQQIKNDGFYASTASDIQQMLFTFVNVLQAIVIGFGVLALIVSIFGIINTQYISVLERTQQIGLMKALGASKRDVARLFRYEAAWVGFLGGAVGALAAWGVGTLANPWISDTLNLGDGNYLLMFTLLPSVGVVVLLVIVAIVSGWLPSRKAARLDPIEALRTE